MKQQLNKWLPFAICLVLGFMVSRAFPPKQAKTYLPELIAEKDKQIDQAKEREKEADQRAEAHRQEAQKKIDRDTVFITRLINNDKKIQTVVSSVNNATKDELRRFVSDY